MDIERKRKMIRKEDEYRRYINDHISNVKKAWRNLSLRNDDLRSIIMKTFNIDTNEVSVIFSTCNDNINTHDASKYGKNEFDAYRKKFFPIDEKEREDNAQAFEEAWTHHKENNMHHWNWWAENGQKENVPVAFVIEMCCDWIAMSDHHNNGTAIDWYNAKEQENIKLGKKQKELVEEILDLYYTYYDVNGKALTTDE